MHPDEERNVVAAALSGDPVAVRRLVALLTPVVKYRAGLALLRLRPGGIVDHAQEVQDLTQEILLQLFKDGGRLLRTWDPSKGASLRTFVGLVAQRRAISILRSRSGVERLSDDLSEIESEAANATPVDAVMASRQELQLILSRLQARLSPLGLELFYRLLCYQESIDQICASTGLSANAVYIWRNRLVKLVQVLAEEIRAESSLTELPAINEPAAKLVVP